MLEQITRVSRIRKKYTFADIFVFLRTQGGYVCISDAELRFFDLLPKHNFYSNSDYTIGLWSDSQFLITDTTIEELLLLANISEKSHFYEQLNAHIADKTASDICAFLCSKRINKKTDCNIVLDENNDDAIFSFRKFQRKDDKRLHPIILRKKFRWGITKNEDI